MKKFLKSLLLFVFLGILIGEVLVRSLCLVTDIPRVYLDKKNKLVRYFPNQTGNYMRGDHKWIINKYGEFGYEPKSLKNLVTVIGDSYISNIMNPPECHQANYLSQLDKKYNFYPSSREGATFLEMMQRAKALEDLKPKYQLLYLSDEDFAESIVEYKKVPISTQLSVKENKLFYYEPTHNDIKFSLQHYFKFFYYLYRQESANDQSTSDTKIKKEIRDEVYYQRIEKLASFTKENFNCTNVILVFRPNSDKRIISIMEQNGFHNLLLKVDNPDEWKLPTNRHWSCYGHEEAAKQVAKNLSYLK